MLMDDLARNWWVFAIRGLAALLFGLFALFVPGITILSLVLVFAAYAVVDGVFAITAAVRAGKAHKKWGALALEGLVGILAGIVTAVLARAFGSLLRGVDSHLGHLHGPAAFDRRR